MDLKYIFALICFVFSAFADYNYNDDGPRKRYDGYSVLRIIPDTEEKQKFVHNLVQEFDVWLELKTINQPTDVMIPPGRLQEIKEKLDDKKINYLVSIPDVQRLIDQESQRLRSHEDFATEHP